MVAISHLMGLPSAGPNSAAIGSFLRDTLGSDVHLVAIGSDAPPAGHWFGNEIDKAIAWAASRNAQGANVYWTVNRVRVGCHRKPKKTDIDLARFAHVDVDPPKDGVRWDKAAALADLTGASCEPSFIIDSGGGLQAFWRLDEQSPNLPAIEAINVGLRDRFNGDNCQNIDRLMRLPGTINYPNAKKRAAGRTLAMAHVVADDDGTAHAPLTLTHHYRPPPAEVKAETPTPAHLTEAVPFLTADDLGLAPLDEVRATIDHPPGQDRSADALACAGAMARAGFSDAQIEGVLLNPANAVSEHCRSQRNAVRAAMRCISKARSDIVPAQPAALLPLIDPAAWASQETPTRTWALYEMILVGQATYLTGAGATGKSLMGQQLATCIATDTLFLGLAVRQGVALYLTCEDDADELHRRQKSICEALGVELAALSGKLHLVSLAGAIGNELATFDVQGRMHAAPAWQRLRETVLGTRAAFVVLDNVAHLFAGNENIRNQVAAFLSLLNGLAAETGAAILLIGHPNKAGDSFSGSTAWENQVRSRIFLDRPRDADGSVLDPDARVLSKGKANYSRHGDALAFRWHQWAFVREDDLPDDQRGEMAAAIAATADNSVFMACLAERTRQQRAVSEKVGRNLAPIVFAGMPESKRIGKARLEAAMDRLFRVGAIERAELWKGPDRKPVVGLRLVRETPAGNGAETRCGNAGNVTAQTREEHTPYTTYRDGGASEGPPPSLPMGEPDPADLVFDAEDLA